MISVDISNVWGRISLPQLLSVETEISDAHKLLMGDLPETTPAGWLKIPAPEDALAERIRKTAQRICGNSQVCVVVGLSGALLGCRAAMELLQGANRNFGRDRGNPQIFFTGSSLSSRHWNELQRLLEGKDFSVIAVSKSGTTLESAVALRGLRWILERRYGTQEAASRIYAVTDPENGPLADMAKLANWELFPIPQDVTGPFAVFTPAALLPMAVAGIDIDEFLRGAARAVEDYSLRSFENPLWLCAAVRNTLWRAGLTAQLLAGFEPGIGSFGRWWQQLFAAAEGKDGKGLLPLAGEFPADLYTLGPVLQEGGGHVFETLLRFDSPESGYTIGSQFNDAGGLNYLAGKQLDEVEEHAFCALVSAHADANVPVITVDCGEVCESTLGGLFCFWQMCACICAHAMGVDPYCRKAMAPYLENLTQLLGQTTVADL